MQRSGVRARGSLHADMQMPYASAHEVWAFAVAHDTMIEAIKPAA
jgi:hypothetical protein